MNLDTLISLCALLTLGFLIGKGRALVPRKSGWRRRGIELVFIALESVMIAVIFSNTFAFRATPAGSLWHAYEYMDDISLLLSLNLRPDLAIDWSVALRLAATLFVIGTTLAVCQGARRFKLASQQTRSLRGSRTRRWFVVGGWIIVASLVIFQTNETGPLVTLPFWTLVASLIFIPRVIDERASLGTKATPSNVVKRALSQSPYGATFLLVALGISIGYWNTALDHPFGAFLLSGLAWFTFSVTFLKTPNKS
jgi:hypothetical protein